MEEIVCSETQIETAIITPIGTCHCSRVSYNRSMTAMAIIIMVMMCLRGYAPPCAASFLPIACTLLFLFFVNGAEGTSSEYSRSVELPLGKVNGIECGGYPEVTAYLGIPFAESPIGNHRFTPPLIYNQSYPRDGYNATENPRGCGTPCNGEATITMQTIDEDCLFLNIWAPANAISMGGKLPVRVYIHGGINLACTGSDPQLIGCYSVSWTNTIQVNLQYRLGAFGFLAHRGTWEESNTTSNWGLMDQILGLQWVQENIEAFGGDPKKVLLYGSSSGGAAVTLHTIMPASSGLFSAAVAQSSMCGDPISLDEAYNLTEQISEIMGCSTEDSAAELACLREKSIADYIAAAPDYTEAINCYQQSKRVIFSPTMEGFLIPDIPENAIASGAFSNVPYMIGLNKKEGTFLYQQSNPENYSNVSEEDIIEFVESVLPSADSGYILSLYPKDLFKNETYPLFSRMAAIWTDVFIACPAHNILNARSIHSDAKTYAYLFTHTPSCPVANQFLGCTHGSELYFLFGVIYDIPPPDGTCNFTDEEAKLSQAFQHAWSAMAEGGRPLLMDGTVFPQMTMNTNNATILDLNITFGRLEYMDRCDLINAAAAADIPLPPLPSEASSPLSLNSQYNLKTEPESTAKFKPDSEAESKPEPGIQPKLLSFPRPYGKLYTS